MRIKVDISGAKKTRQALEDYAADKIAEVDKQVERSARQIQADARKNAPVNFGNLRSGIVVTGERGERHITSTKDYSAAVEFGSKPHWAPIRPLKLWAKRVLGDESAAYAIQKTIAKKGTREQPFLFPAAEKERGRFVEAIKRILRDG